MLAGLSLRTFDLFTPMCTPKRFLTHALSGKKFKKSLSCRYKGDLPPTADLLTGVKRTSIKMNDAATQVSSFEAAPERPAFF